MVNSLAVEQRSPQVPLHKNSVFLPDVVLFPLVPHAPSDVSVVAGKSVAALGVSKDNPRCAPSVIADGAKGFPIAILTVMGSTKPSRTDFASTSFKGTGFHGGNSNFEIG